MIKRLTSVSFIKVAEGMRLFFTYSEINELGETIRHNVQDTRLVMDATELDVMSDNLFEYVKVNLLK